MVTSSERVEEVMWLMILTMTYKVLVEQLL
jgi:hypothetical protein